MLTETQKRIESVKEEKAVLAAQLADLMADTENFDEDAEKLADDIEAKIEACDKKLKREERLAAIESESRRSAPNASKPEPKTPVSVEPAWKDDPQLGFKSHQEFLAAVISEGSNRPKDARNEKLRFLATAGSDEQMGSSDSYGGYAIPEGFDPRMRSVSPEMDPIGGRVTQIPMGSPKISILARTDKNHSSSVSGGLQFYRRHETQAATSSRMQMEKVSLNANTLTGLSYATEELLADSAISMAAILDAGFRDQLVATKIKERIRGTGAGEFEGILNCPATITVTRETTDVITDQDVTSMRSRCWNYSNAVWLANHDALDTLMGIYIAYSTISAQPLFKPGNGTDVPDTLLGRPIYFTEYASTLATTGDLILADWSQYLEGTYQALQSASSTHVRFVEHEMAFKFFTRNDGRSWWRSALTPEQSTTTLSPFVILNTDT